MAQTFREGLCLLDVLCPRYSKTGIGTAVKCCPSLTRQPALSPPAPFYSPVLGPHIAWHTCMSRTCEPLPLVAVWLHSVLLGWFSEATWAQQWSCSARRNSNTLLTEHCLHEQDGFLDICRKNCITVFVGFLIMIFGFFF